MTRQSGMAPPAKLVTPRSKVWRFGDAAVTSDTIALPGVITDGDTQRMTAGAVLPIWQHG
jgi:hypothetical protein